MNAYLIFIHYTCYAAIASDLSQLAGLFHLFTERFPSFNNLIGDRTGRKHAKIKGLALFIIEIIELEQIGHPFDSSINLALVQQDVALHQLAVYFHPGFIEIDVHFYILRRKNRYRRQQQRSSQKSANRFSQCFHCSGSHPFDIHLFRVVASSHY
ncbi:hypothetical protein ABD76_21190 [Paenibacillus dendritiformis]|nr:hypothetical protein [Paenibacillus dendritiformis]